MNFAKHKTQKEKEEEEKKRGGAPFGPGARAASRVASIGVRSMPVRGGLAGFLTGGNLGSAVMIMTGLLGMAAAAGSHYLSNQIAAQNKAANDTARARALMISGHRERSATNTSGNFGGDGLSMLSAANRADTIGGDAGDQNANNQAQANANAADANGSNGQTNAQPTADANANAGGQGQAGGGNRIGRLTSSMGSSSGGLAGGSGLSGGIGRAFSQFPSQGSANGQLTAMSRQAAASTGRTASSRTPGFNSRLASLRRLGGMNGAMKNASGMGTQAQSQIHSDQWSSGQAPNSAIQGGGSGLGTPGAGSGSAGDMPASQEGPIASGFQQMPHGVNTSDAPPINSPANATPFQSQIDLAEMLIMVASGLLILATALGLWAQHLQAAAVLAASNPFTIAESAALEAQAVAYFGYAQTAATAAAACAAMVLMMGIMIMTGYGQKTQGQMLTISGGILTAVSAVAAYGFSQAASGVHAACEQAAQQAATQAQAAADTANAGLPSSMNQDLANARLDTAANPPPNNAWNGDEIDLAGTPNAGSGGSTGGSATGGTTTSSPNNSRNWGGGGFV